MKMIKVDEVFSKDLIMVVADLANEIWHEHYSMILASDQIDYMVEKYQSEEAIGSQIIDGYKYYLAEVDGEYVGYIGMQPQREDGKMFIRKVYVLKEYRGLGIASRFFELANEIAKNEGLTTLWLTVNRQNIDSVAVYRHEGYETVREEDTPIGKGFVMNDYVMEKTVE